MVGRFAAEDSAVSTVVGVVMLIAIVVLVMTVLGAQILSAGVFERQPSVELVYEEQPSGEVIVGVEDVRGLSSDETHIQLQGGPECRQWPGTGTIEVGETVSFDQSDCNFQVGDELQVIGSNTLVDTYELRGTNPPWWDYSCDVDGPLNSTGMADDDDVTIDTGDSVECSFTDSSEDRNFDISNNSALIGDVNTSDGDFDVDNATVYGYVVADGDDLVLTNEATITRFAYSDGNIDIDGNSTVDGPVLATGDIDVDGSTIDGKIYTDDAGDVTVSGGSDHDGIVELEDEDAVEEKLDEYR